STSSERSRTAQTPAPRSRTACTYSACSMLRNARTPPPASASTSRPLPRTTRVRTRARRPRRQEGRSLMARPITLFTGQWADLPFEEVARLAGEWGYDGLEIASWGDHLDPWRAAEDDAYVKDRLDILEKNGLKVFAISNHLKGQAVCDDPIDQRHRDILPERIWGDGDPEGVRQRAAEELKVTARAAARLGVNTVTGFTGSAIWKYVAMFPPVSE